MDAGKQVFDDVFQLALGFDDGAHALQVFRLDDALDEGDGVALGDMIEIEPFRSFGFDADLVDAEAERSAIRARISSEMGTIRGAARMRVVSMFTIR